MVVQYVLLVLDCSGGTPHDLDVGPPSRGGVDGVRTAITTMSVSVAAGSQSRKLQELVTRRRQIIRCGVVVTQSLCQTVYRRNLSLRSTGGPTQRRAPATPLASADLPPLTSCWGSVRCSPFFAVGVCGWLTISRPVKYGKTVTSKSKLLAQQLRDSGFHVEGARLVNNTRYHIQHPERLFSPSLVIFKEQVAKNMDLMIKIAGSVDRLRPHCKTHKMAALIRWQLQLGITRHKCATIAEAEMLCDCGVTDVVLAYPPVGPNVQRVSRLMKSFPNLRLIVTADHPKVLSPLSEEMQQEGLELGVLLDVNTGMNRTGIEMGPSAVELYRSICERPGILAEGLHVYDGHHRQPDRQERCRAVAKLWEAVLEFKQELAKQALPVPRIVAGGTGSFPCFAQWDEPGLELSPGTVVFFDAGYQQAFPDLNFEPASLLLTRVISRPAPDLLTLDLGHKACAADPAAGSRLLFPDLPDKVEVQQNEEHLVIRTERADQYQPGDALLAIPWHACPTSAVHQMAYVIEHGEWTETWEVTARDRVLTI